MFFLIFTEKGGWLYYVEVCILFVGLCVCPLYLTRIRIVKQTLMEFLFNGGVCSSRRM